MKYFIIDNNEQRGPFTIDELYHLHITSETLVWNETMTDWTPAWKVQELKYILEQQHPHKMEGSGYKDKVPNRKVISPTTNKMTP